MSDFIDNFTVGVSCASLSHNNGIIDGIGHYTQQIINSLPLHNFSYKKFVFPPIQYLNLLSPEPMAYMPHIYKYYMKRSLLPFGKNRNFSPNIDIFHCTDYRLIPMKCPTVTTIHDAIPMVHPEWSNNNIRRKLANFCIKRSAKFADHVLTISKYATKDILLHFGINENNISIIPLAADDKWFTPIDTQYYNAVLHKYGLSEGYFLSVGTIQPRKNFSNLIDAYLSLPLAIQKQRKLVIVGKYGWNAEALAARMCMLHEQGKGRILWLANVDSDEELRCIYKGAGVFVFPSLYEGFGLPVVEAFASGIPVICSNTTSLPEVSNGAALEINPASIGELAEAMQLLSQNSAERDKRIKLGNIRAMQLQWQNTMQQTVNVYKQILKTKG